MRCYSFQSQTRSRSTCDSGILYPSSYLTFVSISDEKPLHMRQPDGHGGFDVHFVSISDEKPLHMRQVCGRSSTHWLTSFNLRREAAPHATRGGIWLASPLSSMFQSQTRSRSTCDLSFMVNTLSPLLCFNLRREAAPHATFLFFLQAYAILR